MKRLKISIVSSHDVTENDFKIRELFNTLLQAMQDKYPATPYKKLDFINFSFNGEAGQVERDCIATINPAKYLLCKRSIDRKLIPLFAVKKVYQKEPYFPAFFISNKLSEIESIRSTAIRKVYAVSKNSTSGYIAPIFKLWESGIIETPNEDGIRKKGWDIQFVGSHKEVEQRVLEDLHAIGATGQYSGQENPDEVVVRVLLRYYYLPQDVLVISSNLKPYRQLIEDWFLSVFAEGSPHIDLFFHSSNRVTGLQRFTDEFRNALNELDVMTQYVHHYDPASRVTVKGDAEMLTISDKLKKRLAQSKLEEVIEELLDHFSALGNDVMVNEMIMHAANYNSINLQERKGLLDDEDVSKRINQLNRALLRVIDAELKDI